MARAFDPTPDSFETPDPQSRAAAPKTFSVQINLALLREHLAAEDDQDFTEHDVRRWLGDAGFTPKGDRWVVGERDLGQLQPAEIISAQIIDAAD
jgi:hypothetical protein